MSDGVVTIYKKMNSTNYSEVIVRNFLCAIVKYAVPHVLLIL